jgi:hypothetical protein
MANASTAPIMENENVRELLVIMEENRVPTMNDFLNVLMQVSQMERQLNTAVDELQAMRRELNAARDQAHKTTFQNAFHTLESNTATMRERLDTVKQNIIEGCKNAVSAFKEKGISALDGIARFFKIKPILEVMRNDLNKAIRADDRTIATIEAVSAEYHQAGRHIKNMARAMAGKEAAQDAKVPGKLAKALEAPVTAARSCYSAINKNLEAAINSLTRLEKATERKPSIQKTMQTLNEQIANAPKSIAAPAVRRDER